jgi:hypothetical protein
MKPFQKKHLDGTPRYPHAVASRSAANKSRVSNGKRPFDRRSSDARRLEDLTASFLREFEAPSEAAIAIARSAGLARLRIERIEAREMAGKEIDDERLVRLMGAVNRSVQALAALKPKGEPRRDGAETLVEHLERMARRKAERLAAEAAAERASAREP